MKLDHGCLTALIALSFGVGTGPLQAASYPFTNPFQPNPAETSAPLPTQQAVPEGLGVPGRTIWQQETLTGDWCGQREQLLYRGLAFSPVWQAEVFGNPTGGQGQGIIFDGIFNLG